MDDELSAKLDDRFRSIDETFKRMDRTFVRMDEKFERIDETFIRIDERFQRIDARFDALEKKVDQGFNDSKVRDEELRRLMSFGLEAREVLSDEMHRRFDEAARKHDDQVALLRGAIQHFTNRK